MVASVSEVPEEEEDRTSTGELTKLAIATYDDSGEVDYQDVFQQSIENFQRLTATAGQFPSPLTRSSPHTPYPQVREFHNDSST